MRIVAEVYARRLGSPLDSTIELRSAGGGLLAANDDCEDKCAGLVTHQADSRIEATLKKDGPVYLTLRDAQGHGGPEYCYRLRVGPPRPDFELRVVPSSLSVRAGATIPVTVHALRRDGFAGDIRVALVDPPAGFRLSGGWVPGGQDQIRMTLTAPGGGSAEPAELRLEGSATIDGVEVRRQAAPAEDMMQAFAYRHLVPSQSWMVAVLGRAPFAQAARPSDDTPVKLRLGAATRLRAPLPRGPAGAAPEADLSGAPEGFGIRKVATDWGGTALEVTVDAAKVKPGLKGNLIVELYREPAAQGAARPAAARRRTPVGMLPAIPFEVVAGPEPAR
jgi:hypothetical protein